MITIKLRQSSQDSTVTSEVISLKGVEVGLDSQQT